MCCDRLLRHGRSKANEAGIIVSRLVCKGKTATATIRSAKSPPPPQLVILVQEDGVKQEWALAEAGKKQAIDAG